MSVNIESSANDDRYKLNRDVATVLEMWSFVVTDLAYWAPELHSMQINLHRRGQLLIDTFKNNIKAYCEVSVQELYNELCKQGKAHPKLLEVLHYVISDQK